MKILDWIFGRTAMKQRIDKLAVQNRRLGLEILELRKMKIPKRKAVKIDGRLKQLAIREESFEVKKYKIEIDSQRSSLITRKLRAHVSTEVFKAICEEVNGMTDEQIHKS